MKILKKEISRERNRVPAGELEGIKKFMVNYLFRVNKRSLPFSHIRLVSEPSSWK